ncbi:MAG TPA: dienelactone hydrolase family protein [Pseudonocardiaceae bacterium]|jgi:dienelactone hydrolase|nr:dienelactone hydrolase family protein [Pseudonocardiaceae bacterium]
MSEIVLIHSVLGVRPGVLSAARRLRAAGHTVHVPDLYGGKVFDDYAEADQFVQGFGSYPELLRRTAEAVSGLGTDLVYAGFSNGAGGAAYLAATRPGARAAVLMNGTLPMSLIGSITGSAPTWPSTVPVQAHYGRDDPKRIEAWTREFAEDVRGAKHEFWEYPVASHLFADESLPDEYDQAAAELMWQRVLSFLD